MIHRFLCLVPLAAILSVAPRATASVLPDGETADGPRIDYDVSVDVAREVFKVHGRFRHVSGDTVVYHFPIWGPGAYDIVTFGGWVDSIAARDRRGRKLKVVRADTSTVWIIGGKGTFEISYLVRDIERLEGSPWFGLTDIEAEYAFANTVAIFGYPAGYKETPHTVRYQRPKGWDLSIGLSPIDSATGYYRAHDYDELVDAPVHMGTFQRVDLTIRGRHHVISITAPQKLTEAQLADIGRMADTVVRTISGFFDDMPYERYIFQIFFTSFNTTDYSFGALEHRNSSSYRMPFNPSRGLGAGLAAVFAHEYWHLWSPKRIHVHQLGPFDYQSPPRTKSIWFAEGLTEYYAQVMLARAQLPGGRRGTLDYLEGIFRNAYRRPQSRSMTDLSLHASQVPMMEFIAFYSKGPVVGLLLDAAIRKGTEYRKSLDDAILHFNAQYGRTGRSFSDDEIITIMEDATGASLRDFYNRYIDGTEPLPFDELLPVVGMKITHSERKQDMLGATTIPPGASDSAGWLVTEIAPGGTADSTGLRVGDTIVAMRMRERTKERDYPASSFPDDLWDYPLSTRLISLSVRRGEQTLTFTVRRVAVAVVTYELAREANASPQARAARASIFGD